MENKKFKVLGFENTPSGHYAHVSHPTSEYSIIQDFGWKVGDEVELIGYDGIKPKRMIVNGNEVTAIKRVTS